MSIKKLICISGATATGKTSLAIDLAKLYNTEIVSFDSRQFYSEMNIGTAKPTQKELNEVRHHFIGHKSVTNIYNVGDFEKDANILLSDLFSKYDIVIAVGGSGLYLRAIIDGLDTFPTVDSKIREELNSSFEINGLEHIQKLLIEKDPKYSKVVDIKNPRRIIRALEVCISSGLPYSSFINKKKKKNNFQVTQLAIEIEKDTLYKRINSRVDVMIEDGLLEEVKKLLPYSNLQALHTVGYTELISYLKDEISYEVAIEKIKQNSRNYAKRQLTWFRKDNRINWVHHDNVLLNAKLLLSSNADKL
jgi:tRNA dimethylallyltransferase